MRLQQRCAVPSAHDALQHDVGQRGPQRHVIADVLEQVVLDYAATVGTRTGNGGAPTACGKGET
jgi:hypothetical protein